MCVCVCTRANTFRLKKSIDNNYTYHLTVATEREKGYIESLQKDTKDSQVLEAGEF